MNKGLIDAYLAEIGRQLPRKTRQDIEEEIRSALMDILEARHRESGKEIDDEMVLEVLQEFGSPEKVASSYQGDRSLIGPRLYPAYINVLQIVLPIMGVLALVGLGVSLSRSGYPSQGAGNGTAVEFFITTIANAVGSFFGSLISALGSITLIFALLERYIPDLKTKPKTWDARSLLKIRPPETVKPIELIFEIFFASLGILIFNFFPGSLVFTPSLNSVFETGNWQAVTLLPIVSEAFLSYVPYITILAFLTIIMDSILIQRGRWEDWSRWMAVALKVLGISLAAVMLAGPSLVAEAVTSAASGLPPVAATLLSQGIRLGLILAIIFGSLDLIKMVYRLFKHKNIPSIQLTK